MGDLGYSGGKNTSNSKQPWAYGVSDGPVISTCGAKEFLLASGYGVRCMHIPCVQSWRRDYVYRKLILTFLSLKLLDRINC